MHAIIVIGAIGHYVGLVVFVEGKLSDTSVISSTEATWKHANLRIQSSAC